MGGAPGAFDPTFHAGPRFQIQPIERHRDDAQAEAEAPPDSLESHPEPERQPRAEGKSEEVVAEQVGERGGDGGAHAAQDAAPDHLRSVEELERGGHRQNRRAQSDHRVVLAELGRQRRAEADEEERRDRHHSRAHAEGYPGRPLRLLGIARPYEIPDPRRGGDRDSEWHHERERGEPDDDEVAGELHRTETPSDQRSQSEGPDFEGELDADRYPVNEDLPQASQIERGAAPRNPGLVMQAEAQDPHQEDHHHHRSRECRRDARAHDAELRKLEIAEDQEPVEEEV